MSVEIPEDSDGIVVAEVTVKTDTGCVLTASEVGQFCSPPKPYLFDEFGSLTSGNVKARLNAFMIELQQNRYSRGFIINFGSKRKVARRERVMRNHLKYRSYDVSRIVFVNGGIEKEIRTKFWVVSKGADESKID